MKSMCPNNEQSFSHSTKPCLRRGQAPLSKLFNVMLDGLMAMPGDSKRKRHIRRLLSLATVLALVLQIVPLGLPAPSEVVTSLLEEAPPPLDTFAPIAKEVTAPFDALAAPFSNPPPLAYAAPVSPTGYITITKSYPATAYQYWEGPPKNRARIDFTYEITITNETSDPISPLAMRITPTLPTGVPNWDESGGGTGGSGWAMAGGPGPIYFLNVSTTLTSTSYVGYYFLHIFQAVPDRTMVTDTQTFFLYNGSQYTETHTYTTTVRAPAYGVSIIPSQGTTVCAGNLVTYTITVSNAGGVSMYADPFSVTAELPTNVITHSTDGGISQGNRVSWTYPVLAVGAAVSRTLVISPTGVWNNGDSIVITATALANAEVTPTVSTSNTVTVDRLTAEFTTTPAITVSINSAVTFTDTYTDPASTTHTWEFGDGVTTTVIAPTSVVTHAYSSVGSYVVTQTVSGSCPGGIFTHTIGVIQPELHILKLDTPELVQAGQQLTYTIYYSNTSQAAATEVVITDTLPADITGGTAVPSQEGAIGPGNVITWSVSSVAAGELKSITLVLDVASPLDNGTVLTNTAGIICSSGVYTNTGPVTTTVVSTPTLGIVKSDAPDPVNAGDVLTYTIVYSNSGNMTASGVWITDTFDGNVSFGGSNPAPGGGSGSVRGWNIGSLSPVSGNQTIVITVTVNSPLSDRTVLTNTADITCSERVGDTTGPITTTVVSTATLHIVKTDNPDPVNAGEVLTYTIVYSNSGNMTASGVWITDTFDGNVSFGGSNPAPDGGSGSVRGWNVGSLSPVSGNQTIVITVTVDSPLPDRTVLTNTADITSSERVGDTTGPVTTTVVSTATLHIVKTDAPDPVNAGEVLTYTIVYSGSGNMIASGVWITDTFDGNVSFGGANPAPGGGSGSVRGWNIGSLSPVSGNQIIVITVTVNSPLPDGTVLTNTADITSSERVGDTTGPVTTTVVSTATLRIVKSDAPDPVNAGSVLTYTVVYSNSGNMTASGVWITDTFDGNVSFGGSNPAPDGGSGSVRGWNVGSLSPISGNQTIVVTVTVNSPLPDGTVLTNTADITSSERVGDTTGPVTTTVVSTATLHIVKTDNPDPVNAGEVLTYTIVYSNSGNMTASGVWITDTFDGNVSFGGSNPAPGGGSGSVRRWNIGSLSPVSGSQTIVVTVTVDSPLPDGMVLTNTADITSSEKVGDTTGPVTTTVVSTATLHIVKTDNPDPVNAGEVLTYTIVYSNSGNMTASGVWITDTFDGNVSFGGSNPAPGGGSGNVRRWDIGSLNPISGNQTIVITVTVNSPLPDRTVLTNTADITCSERVGDTSGPVTTTVVSTATLHVVKSDAPDPVNAGEVLTYTIVYSSSGNMIASGVWITDTFDGNVSFGGANPAPSGGSGSVRRWNIGNLSPISGNQTIVITVTVNNPLPDGTVLTNTADITCSERVGDTSGPVTTTVVSTATLHIVKADAPDPVNAGDVLTYTIVYSNGGNMTAGGVWITDTFDGNVSFGGANPAPGGGSGSVRGWNIGSLSPVSGNQTIVITVAVNSPLPDGTVLTNTADITSSERVGDTSGPVTTTVVSTATLHIVKSDTPDPVNAGEVLTYTIVYSNSGNMTAGGVWITDTFDGNVSFGGSNPAPGGGSGSVRGWDIGSLSSISGNQTIVITVTVDSPLPDRTVLTNTADITSSERVGDTSGPVTTTVESTATLHIVKSDAPDPVNAGDVLTYTIVYSNSGNMTAGGVWITDTFDGKVSFGWSNPAPDGGSGSKRSWYTDTLAPSDNYTIVITVTVSSSAPDGQVLTNTADITCRQGVSDNTGSVTTTVRSTDLVITKTVTPTTPLQPGDWLTYTLTFANQGQVVATGVVITDIYQPISLTNVISTSSGATVTPTAATPPYTWEVEDLSYGEGGVITITAQVTPSQTWAWSTILTNTAYITTTQPDGDGSNDTDWVTSTIQTADVMVSKNIQPATVVSSDTITYTLVYTNAGAGAAQNVYLTDTLPAGVSYGGLFSETPNWPGTPTYTVGPPQTVTWFTSTLAGGASGTIVITATVDFTDVISAVFTNTVQITTTTPESDTSNNVDQDSNQLSQATDVAITKTVIPTAPLRPGDWLTYTLTFANQGQVVATGVVITDIYQPISLTNVISTSSGATVTPTAATPPYTWNVRDLSYGEGGVITITAQVDPSQAWGWSTILTNTAYITTTQPDGDGTNDTDWVTSTIQTADVMVSKNIQPATVVSSDTITYTLVYTNAGAAAAQNVCLTDTLPAGVSYGGWVGETPNRFGLPTPDSGGPESVTWCTPTLAGGASGTIVITATVDFTDVISAIFTNTVQITTTTPESDASNNTDQASNQLFQAADVTISKVVAPTASLQLDDWLTYTLTFSNQGQVVATGVMITDIYQPVSLTNVSVISSGVMLTLTAATPPPYTWEVQDLSYGEGGVITITAQVTSTQTEGWSFILTNTAYITTTQGDGDGTNDTDEVTSNVRTGGGIHLPIVLKSLDVIPPPPTGDLIVTNITFSPSPPVAGQTYHVIVTIQNTGTLPVSSDFWVDLYLSPDTSTGHPVPPTINHIWPDYCPGGRENPAADCYGAAWRVTQDLAPGEILDLNTNTLADSRYSNWPPPNYSSSHSPFYAQVDSWGYSSYGSASETNENNNWSCRTTGSGACLAVSAVSSGALSPGSRPSGPWEPRPTLPPRSEPVITITPTLVPTSPTATLSLPTSTPTPSLTPGPTATPLATSEPGMTDTPTTTPSPLPSTATSAPAATPAPTLSPTPVPTATPSATPEPRMTDTPTPSATQMPTSYPTPVPTVAPSATPALGMTDTPTATPSPMATAPLEATETPTPTAIPVPALEPTAETY